jgi:hypothetical protein
MSNNTQTVVVPYAIQQSVSTPLGYCQCVEAYGGIQVGALSGV